jgi:hypothetical protein
MSKKFDVYWWKDKSRENLNRIYRLWLDIIIRIDTFFFMYKKKAKLVFILLYSMLIFQNISHFSTATNVSAG